MAVDTMSTPTMVSAVPAKRGRESQFGLMWRRFKRHKLALVSLWVVGLFYLVALLAEFLAPVDPGHYSARYTYAPPQGRISLRRPRMAAGSSGHSSMATRPKSIRSPCGAPS